MEKQLYDEDLEKQIIQKEIDDKDYLNNIIQNLDNQTEEQLQKLQENQIQNDHDPQERLQKLKDYKDPKLQTEINELQDIVDEQEKLLELQHLKKQQLQEEIEINEQKLKNQDTQIIALQSQNNTDEQIQYQNQIEQLRSKIKEAEDFINQTKKENVTINKDNRNIEKEIEALNKEQKKSDQEINKKDIKINRIQEDIDKQKIQLQQNKMKKNTKNADDYQLKQQLQHENIQLEKQIIDLLGGFKKQLRLIDILKRQKNHLLAGYMFQYIEDSFIKTLELGEKI